MKIGDLIVHERWPSDPSVVVDFLPVSHPKQVQKVVVLNKDGLIERWVMQFCDVVNESR